MIRLVMKNLIKSNLTGKEILSSDQSRIIEIAKLAYSPLGKAFEKQTKIIEEQRKKQVKALKVSDPEKTKKTNNNWRIFSKRKEIWWKME